MGTSGYVAVRYRGVYYILYNPLDSYPTKLGLALVALLGEYPDVERWKCLFDRATFVKLYSEQLAPPSAEFLENVRLFILSDEELTDVWEIEWFVQNVARRMANGAHRIFPSLGTAMDCLQDSKKFRDYYLPGKTQDVEWSLTTQDVGWYLLCKTISYYPKLMYHILELGFFVLTEKPSYVFPEIDKWIEYVYVINLDCCAFSVQNGFNILHFRFDNIPKHWIACLDVPVDWIKLAHGYSPSAINKVMSIKLGIDKHHIWNMVLEKMSGQPYEKWEHYLTQVHDHLFPQNETPKELDVELRDDLFVKGVGPFRMLMEVLCIPTSLPSYLVNPSVKLNLLDPALRSQFESIAMVREDDELLCLAGETLLLEEPILSIIFHKFVSDHYKYFDELPGLSLDMARFVVLAQSVLAFTNWKNVNISMKALAAETVQEEAVSEDTEEVVSEDTDRLVVETSKLPWIKTGLVWVLLALQLDTKDGQTLAIAVAAQHFQEMAREDDQKEQEILLCAFSVSHVMAIRVLGSEAGITVTHTRAVPVIILRDEYRAMACDEGFKLLLHCLVVRLGHENELMSSSRNILEWWLRECIHYGNDEAIYEVMPKDKEIGGLSEVLKVSTSRHDHAQEQEAVFDLGERELKFVECLNCEATLAGILPSPMPLWISRFA